MDGLFDFEKILRQLHSNMSGDSNASDGVPLQSGLAGNVPVAGAGTLAVVAGLFDRSVAPVVVIAGLIGNLVAHRQPGCPLRVQ